MERPDQVATKHNMLRRAEEAGAIGASALAFAGILYTGGKVVWWDRLDKAGEMIHVEPPQSALHENVRRFGREVVVITYNLHAEAANREDELRRLAKQADVLAMQEITFNDVRSFNLLARDGLYTTIAKADARQKLGTDWQGNAIITKQYPQNPAAKAIRGTSYTKTILGSIDGFFTDVAQAETSLKNTADGSQEDRVAQAVTIQAMNGDNPVNIRIINAHISGNREVGYIFGTDNVHKNQREELEDIISEELEKKIPIILMGDFNGQPKEIVPRLSSLGLTVVVTGPTFTDGVQRLDYIAYHPAGLGKSFTLKDIKVLKEKTDHHAVRATFILPAPEKFALKYKRPFSEHQQSRNELELHYRK